MDFTKYQILLLTPSVVSALVETGVVPSSLRILKGTIDFSSQLVQANGLAVLDPATGSQIRMLPGEQVLLLQVVATDALTSGGAATLDVGLSEFPAGSTVGTPDVTTAIVAAQAFGDFTAGVAPVPAPAGDSVVVVGASDVYLAVDINDADLTAGALQVVVIAV